MKSPSTPKQRQLIAIGRDRSGLGKDYWRDIVQEHHHMQAPSAEKRLCACCRMAPIAKGHRFLCADCFRHGGHQELLFAMPEFVKTRSNWNGVG